MPVVTSASEGSAGSVVGCRTLPATCILFKIVRLIFWAPTRPSFLPSKPADPQQQATIPQSVSNSRQVAQNNKLLYLAVAQHQTAPPTIGVTGYACRPHKMEGSRPVGALGPPSASPSSSTSSSSSSSSPPSPSSSSSSSSSSSPSSSSSSSSSS